MRRSQARGASAMRWWLGVWRSASSVADRAERIAVNARPGRVKIM